MKSTSPQEVTQLLHAWRKGDQAAFEQLLPLVYDELRQLARRYLRRERQGHTLQTSALVHEAYLRLIKPGDAEGGEFENRAHFFGIAAHAMRRVLVDNARRRNFAKRGGGVVRHVELEEAATVSAGRDAELVALDDALQELARIDSRKCRVMELRYFGGLSVEETATALGISVATVMREWSTARAWLRRELSKGAEDDA
jgi:RNA polymerase sigma-70 factor, ECF subfamily